MHVSGHFPYETTNTLRILFGRLEYERLDCMLCCPKDKNLISRKLPYPRLIILFIDVVLLKIRVFYLPFRYNECTSKVHNCDNANAFCITFLSDINECTTNVHKCAANAFCNNTDGSYNCTCSPGFTGNGTACTGMSLRPILAKLYYEV